MDRIPSISTSRRHRPQDDVVRQPQLFIEVVETIETRDEPFEHADGGWGSSIKKPPGKGWHVADSRRQRFTKWQRLRAVPWAVRPSSSGWRRG